MLLPYPSIEEKECKKMIIVKKTERIVVKNEKNITHRTFTNVTCLSI